MYFPCVSLAAASSYAMGCLRGQNDLDRQFSHWYGETHHGRPELAFWGGITQELVGDSSTEALADLTPEQNDRGIARFFDLLAEFLADGSGSR